MECRDKRVKSSTVVVVVVLVVFRARKLNRKNQTDFRLHTKNEKTNEIKWSTNSSNCVVKQNRL